MSFVQSNSSGADQPTILCCLCGTSIHPNPANMCVNCLKTQVDITEGIATQVTIFFCKGCGRYNHNAWVTAELESRELLALCLKKIKGLNKAVKLIDAGFIWTEPHSRRLKVKLTIQKEVFNAAIMQQTFVVEFICSPCQCPDCARSYTEHTWTAVTQVRQKVKHKRTFFFLEQCLIKTGVANKAIQIKEMPGGLDFFWLQKTEGLALMEFLRGVVPAVSKESRKLITQDDHNNFKKYKFTQYVELSPVCKHDLAVLPPKLCQTLGGVSPLMICFRISSNIHMIDPLSLKIVMISAVQYWRHPFRPILTQEHCTKYVVIDIEKGDSGNLYNRQNGDNDRMCMADVTVARDSDFGVNDTMFKCVTHLGHILNVGDTVLGYDFQNANIADEDLKTFKGELPEVVLVKKSFARKNRKAKRKFKIKKMAIDAPDKPLKKSELQKTENDFETFLEDLEEDSDMRKHVNMYKREEQKGRVEVEDDDDSDDDDDNALPELTELMDDFSFNMKDAPDDEDADDDDKPIDFGTENSSASSSSSSSN